MPALKTGDPAPDFSRMTHDGKVVEMRAFRGKNAVVLFFYPRDFTPTCTAEACKFRDDYDDFVEAGAVVIGVSANDLDSHRRFTEKHGLPFLLVSDSDGSLRKLFGVPKTLGIFPGRVTYVIDREGTIRHVFNSQLLGLRHVAEALKTVRILALNSKISDSSRRPTNVVGKRTGSRPEREECRYYGELISEAGLAPVAAALRGCSWPIELRRSGYDGTFYLHEPFGVRGVDIQMDSGQSKRYLFSGGVDGSSELALELLGDFSRCLSEAQIVHRVEVDGPAQETIGYFHFGWPEDQPDPV